MQIGLLFTQRCNAACTHCATSCGPDKDATLPDAGLFKVMEEAAALSRGRPLIFSLSGGEPFLEIDRLIAIVAHGKALGGEVTCVTNGYWASSDAKARATLASLQEAGLLRLGVSTSRFHQRFVKLTRVQRALSIAVELGLGTVFKYATTRGDEPEAERLREWASRIGVTYLEFFPVMPYLREGATLPAAEYLTEAGIPRGRCPSAALTVREDGKAFMCCSPGGFVESLSVGNALEDGVEMTYRRYLLNGKQKLLRERGPGDFADAIVARGLGHRLRTAYVGVCDLCAHIASDPVMTAVSDDVAIEHEREYLLAAIEKYSSSAS